MTTRLWSFLTVCLLLSQGGLLAATYYVAKNGADTNNGSESAPWLTVQKAANTVSAGDTVLVAAGNYPELVNLARSASPGNPITFRGNGAEVGGFNCRRSDYIIRGFRMNGGIEAMKTAGALVYAYPATHRLQILDNYIYNATNKYGVWLGLGSNTAFTNSSSFCVVSNNAFVSINYINVFCSGLSNRFVRNLFRDSNGQADCFRLWGNGHIASDNVVTNLAMVYENHADFFQAFGPDEATSSSQYNYVQNIILERNLIINSRIQICQLETFDNPVGNMTNLIFRNNQFINIPYAANVDMDGTKWYNNLFYRVNTGNGGHVFALGGPKGSAYGTEIINNQFVACGNGQDWVGWYPVPGFFGITNYNLLADYNYVCGPSFAPKRTAGTGWGAQGTELHGINGGNPGFVSLDGFNFRLVPSSPLIDAGQTLNSFSDDFLSTQRSAGSWDIGPFETARGEKTDNLAPSISLTAPGDRAVFTAPASILLQASASDRDGSVVLVEYFAGNTKLGQSTTAPHSFRWENVSSGTYSITARATDNQGATANTATVFVTVSTVTVSQDSGHVYFVSTSGNDNNPGSAAFPWRTIQKAASMLKPGETVFVSPGNYGETVTTRNHGTADAPIRYVANPPNDPNQQVIARQFRVQHRHTIIEGFNLTGGHDQNMSTIRVEYRPPAIDGSHTVVRNNTIRDSVYLISDDLRFDHNNNSITTAKGNWLAKGFAPGGYVFLGSSSKNPYENHDTAWRIKSVTANTLSLTNTAGTAFLPEPKAEVWGVVYAGAGNNAYPGVDIVLGAGTTAATNCIISGNTFSNLFGCPIKFSGDNHLVENNFVTRIHGYYGIQPQGRNHLIRNNLWKDCTNFIFFSAQELITIPHPPGSNFFDYQVAFVSSFVDDSTNIVFERNWFQNLHNQMGLISEASGTYGYTFRNNVFVGIQAHMSCSRSGVTIENNTFYRCSFDESRSHALAFGGINGNIQRDLVVRKNLFVDCGSHYSLDNEGYYGIQDSINYTVDENFVCGPETTGFAAKRFFNEPRGLNGGDPSFLSPALPLGLDGLPFTADDGLRPLPNSPFASRGWGALPALTIGDGSPVAHFRVASPTGWFDVTGTNYNKVWYTLEPYQRGDLSRPYHTPEALGTAPVTVTFSAENSIGGLVNGSASTDGITSYRWDFGSGQSVVTTTPSVTRTFSNSGLQDVSLTILNAQGKTHTSTQRYRVLDPVGLAPSAPRNLRAVGGP